MSTDFRAIQAKNQRTTRLLLFASFILMTLVLATVALLTVGGIFAAIAAVAIAGVSTFVSYRSSDRIAIASTGAVPADPDEYRRLHNVVEEMAIAAGLNKPRVFIVVDPAPNAFATGRSPERSAIAATTGLLDKMNRAELQGVIAHEMAHVRNNDIAVMTVAVATAGTIAILADVFWRLLYFGGSRSRSRDNNGGPQAILTVIGLVFVAVLAPIAAAMLRASISRSREGLADASAVELTRNPAGLRQALEKLDADVTVVRRTSHASSHLWIETPDDQERGHKGSRFNSMFNTHPPLAERIDLLRKMEGLAPYVGPTAAQIDDAAAQADTPAPRPPAWAGLSAESDQRQTTLPGATPDQGWYSDPTTAGRLRWWDGHEWTGYTNRG